MGGHSHTPPNGPPFISQVNIRRIHERVVDGLPRSLPYPAQDTPLGNLLRALTGDVILFYARTMKRTVLFARCIIWPAWKCVS